MRILLPLCMLVMISIQHAECSDTNSQILQAKKNSIMTFILLNHNTITNEAIYGGGEYTSSLLNELGLPQSELSILQDKIAKYPDAYDLASEIVKSLN